MTNEHEASNERRDETEITLHEKLCAYILGEANDDERAEVERALATSSELRAEREKLEATIGLVRESMSDGDVLSPEATAEVISAASTQSTAAPRTSSRPWYFPMPMRIAAGIAALTLAYAVLSQHSTRPEGERVAQLTERALHQGALGADRSARNAEPASSALESSAQTSPKIASAMPTPAEAELSAKRERDDVSDLLDAPRRAQLQFKERPSDGNEIASNAPAGSAGATEPTNDRQFWNSVLKSEASPTTANERAASEHGEATVRAAPSSESKRPRAEEPLPSEAFQDTKPFVGARAQQPEPPHAAGLDSSSAGQSTPGPSGPATGGAAGPTAFGGRRLPPVPAPDKRSAGGDDYFLGARRTNVASKDKLAFAKKADDGERLKGLGYVDSADRDERDPLDDVSRKLQQLGYPGPDSDSRELMLEQLKSYRPTHQKYREMLDQLSKSNLTPEQRERFVDEQCRRILEYCYRRPDERPRDMYFRFWGDNAFQLAALDAQSTFSVDVDTASYTLARRYLNEGHLPEKAQVRTEEFVNYFKPDVAAPREGTFAIQTELAPSRFSNDANRTMLRVAVRGREVTKQERKPLALTFVIDCSGSMQEQNRLEMVKHAIRLLVNQLDANDSIAIVAFSSDARMVLPMTSAARKDLIESALYPLKPENSTNSEAGLRMGYEAALAGINANAQNRVVFLSDGVANVGETDPSRLADGVKRIREKGIYLNSIGVGMNNHNDALLEQLADKGDGVCNYIDSLDEARRVMVDNFTGAMETIARDVKIQVEFDPAQVYRYRLLGYENRFIANQDFRNDKIDAGEVGAGHQVCALYELELAAKPAQDAAPKPLATVRLRWKAPRDVRHPDANEEASEIAKPVVARETTSYEGASFGYKRAVVAAQFAEFLRRSTHARNRSFDDLLAEATKLTKQGEDKDVSELAALIEKSRSLILANPSACDDLCQTIDVIRRNQILRAEHDMLAIERDQKTLDEIAKQNAELEARIRELLRKKLEQSVK